MKPLKAAFIAYFVAQAGDVLSTLLAMRLPGMIEANPLVSDPVTHKLALGTGLAIKALHFLVAMLPISIAIKKVTRSEVLAAVPLLWDAYLTFMITFQNLALIYSATHLGR